MRSAVKSYLQILNVKYFSIRRLKSYLNFGIKNFISNEAHIPLHMVTRTSKLSYKAVGTK